MKFSLSSLLLVANAVNGVVFQDCGSTAKDVQIHIAGCSDPDPACPFTTGQKASIEVIFTSPRALKSATVKITASVGIAKVDFPVKPAEACGNWGLQCPAPPGSSQKLKLEVPIDPAYPKVNVGVELQLVADTGEKLICTSFPVQIK